MRKIFKKKQLYLTSCMIIFFLVVFIVVGKNTKEMLGYNKRDVLKSIEIVENEELSTTISTTYDTEDVLLNPGKGMVLNGTKNKKNYNSVVSVGYTRFNWSDIEPQEGKYNWQLIDNAINNFAADGKKFAFGVKCAATSVNSQYVTPKWVFDAGAKGTTKEVEFWLTGEKTIQTIPDWGDSIFLEKLNNSHNF